MSRPMCYRARYKREMTEQSTTISHLSVAITTNEVDNMQSTGGKSMTSSSTNFFEFYFQWAVVVIGVVGTAANALVIYALVASKQHKKHLLIVNQNVLDLFSSFFLMLTYSLKLCKLNLGGPLGYWLCMMLLSENLVYYGITGSIVNLAIVTIDRYLKVVHHIWSKKWLFPWVIYSAMAFAWLASIVYNTTVVFATSGVIDGVCYAIVLSKSNVDRLAYTCFGVTSHYVIILVIFIFCYGRILITVRRQTRVMAGHGDAGSGTVENHLNQLQTNVIKTMVLVSAFYAIAWLPINVYYIYFAANPNATFLDGRYYASMFLSFFYTCTNPFIYVMNFDPVNKVLRNMISCKKTPDQHVVAIGT